ncbi:hypothetical protein BCT04_16115 [Vibrio breoganii]|uniref:hypothetical protein n=1 Tax=Vibrio breoganii TaxID=553239 RepID=UPI000C818157|nr:hypothetical protein [Vibrio breoganii]PMG89374.1 hypothetical protein BCU81_08340 [Vibrio breoganii]PMK28304.1 hypothetical protein BCU03_14145 [Vibrio breoganii]PMO63169.1 hypothetical protein BCT04_16115 [Vibrio breoganii]
MKYSKIVKLSTLALCLSTAFSSSVLAEEKYHDADPRNSSFRGGIGTDDRGEIKLVTGGGFSNEWSGGANTQTNVLLEYYTQTENARLRVIHFDSRFGGAYVDLNHVEDVMNMSTVGYMLPLETNDKKLMFFPSVNYTYVNFDNDAINDGIYDATNPTNSAGANAIQELGFATGTGSNVSAMGAGDLIDFEDAHAASVSLYGVKPWNDTHYTVFQLAAGSSYSGQEMQFGNALFIQGMRTKLKDNVLNIYFEAKYDHFAFENIDVNGMDAPIDRVAGGEATYSVGFDFRF